MWRALRISVLLLILLIVLGQAWSDRLSTTSWQRTVYVGAFAIPADASPVTARYVAQLDAAAIEEVARFVKMEARRYGVQLEDPIDLMLLPPLGMSPPPLDPGASVIERVIWSLKLRWFRSRALASAPQYHPRIVLFLLYHDPALVQSLPHSAGLQRGLTAVVHLFASRSQEAQNRIVVTHELLHTFGASDKYDLASGMPRYPDGFAEPERESRYPQRLAEIMAGQLPIGPAESRLPEALEDERVGPLTAREIGWIAR